jgi:hypothetical protein
MVASDNVFYALLTRCRTKVTCRVVSLASSPAGSRSWSSVPFPSHEAIEGNGASVAIGATGSQVWLTYMDYPAVSGSQFVSSVRGQPPFTTITQPNLGGVVACSLSPMLGDVIWARCPTGMMVSELRSIDGGQHFTFVWSSMGTGGTDFDPVTAEMAFRYLGAESPTVERTTDGGQTFVQVGQLPFSSGATTHLLFLNQQDGFALGYTQVSTLLETTNGGATWTTVNF